MSGDSSQSAATETRRLAAIMFTDIVDFSRQMGSDEARMLRLLEVHNQIIQQAVTTHHGTIIKTVGDAFLVDFPSVVHAVQGAQYIQGQFRTHNAEKESAEQIHVRIGIHLGDIVQKDGDVFGDGVNIAARLQALAEPDTICLSQKVYEEVAKKLALGTVISLGKPKLKNIAERFAVYALLPAPPQGPWQALQVQRLKFSRRISTAQRVVAMGLILIAGTATAIRYLPSFFPDTQPLTPSTQPFPLPDKPSIVVLPFVNMSNDPEQEYFSDGITEDITTDLSQLSSLFVIARNSAFTYKGKAVKVQAVSREMGVRYVLEGSVRKTDNQVRVTAQLIDGMTGGHLWAERYNRPLKDIFALQDEIVQKIVTTLKLQITLWEQGVLIRKTTDNLEAYDFYLRGRESGIRAWVETKKEANVQARQLLEKAVELDPTYAEAYATLGGTYVNDWFLGWNRDFAQTVDRAFELGNRAVVIDDALSRAHEILGWAYLYRKQYDQAIAEAQRAVTLDPNNANAYVTLGTILSWAGRSEEAIKPIETGRRLNPRFPTGYLNVLSFAYRLAGRYEEAVAASKKLLTHNPNFMPAHLQLANCYVQMGRLDEARAEAAEVLRLTPHFSLEASRQNFPFKDPAVLEREIDAWRKAGLK